MSILREFKRQAGASGAPVTTAIVAALVVSFLASWMRIGLEQSAALAFFPKTWLASPWTLLTYPFVGIGGFVVLVFGALWLWGIGGALERDFGSRRYLLAWLAFSALSALCIWAGAGMVRAEAVLYGPAAPIAALTVMWGTRNPSATVMLMFVLPITGRWLAWLAAGFVFFGTEPPILAPFAALPLVLAYFFAAERLSVGFREDPRKGKTSVRGKGFYSQEYFDDVARRKKDREERERLRKLFEDSVDDGDSKDR